MTTVPHRRIKVEMKVLLLKFAFRLKRTSAGTYVRQVPEADVQL